MKTKTWKKAALNASAALLAVFYTGNMIALENAGAINSYLGTSTYEVVNAEDDDGTYARYYESEYSSVADLKEAGYDKATEVEGEGAVLLKNENDTLPLSLGEVSLFGVTSIEPVYGGTGSGSVSADDAPTYQDAFTAAGFTVNDALTTWYTNSGYSRSSGSSGGGFGFSASTQIGEADYDTVSAGCGDSFGHGEDAIYIIGRVGGEGNDLNSTTLSDGIDGDYLKLNEAERSMLAGLKALKDEGKIKSITLIINSANPVAMDFIDDEQYGVDAALWIGSVGQTGLYAVAEILSGEINPSGSLPDTWWVDNRLDPTMANFGSYTYEGAENYVFDSGSNSDSSGESSNSAYVNYVVYQEGIYVGYRYTETRYEDVVMGAANAGDFDYEATVAYPFGYGLSYTEFSFSDLSVSKSGEGTDATYTLTVKVTNDGTVAGKKTAQVYAQKPYTDYDKQNGIEKASVELVGYGKTQELQPGESETLTIEVPEYYLTSYDATGTGVYILDAGDYYLTVADDAHAATNNILAAKGYSTSDGMTDEGDSSMVETLSYEFDSTTYAAAYGTGNEVTSLFGFADINRYEGAGDNSVTYFTRSDWENTLVLWEDTDGDGENDNYVRLSMTDQIAADVVLDDSDIPADEEGDEFPTYGSTETNLQLIDLRVDSEGNEIAYDDPIWDSFMDQLTYAQISKLCAVGLRMTAGVEEIGKPQTIDHNGPVGVTESYGNGTNGYATVNDDEDKDLTGTCYPCNGILAATFNTTLIEETGEMVGEDCMWAGYAGIYGTGCNIHRSPYSGRVFEYYSEDGILSGLQVAAYTKGIQSKGVYVYNKHFALNDQEDGRRGISTWTNEQALREIYLRAFELPITEADAKCVMSAFNRLGAIWSSASHELMTDWLREEAGMSGFAVTDMYADTYMNKPLMVLAGNDTADNYPGKSMNSSTEDITEDTLIAEYAAYGPDGSTPSAKLANAMRESAKRILYTVVHSRGMDGISADSVIVSVTPWWQNALTGVQIAFGVLTALFLVLAALDWAKKKPSVENV